MENIRIKNAALKIRGSVQKTVGKLTGNKKLEARGTANHAAGSVRTAASTVKEPATEAGKKRAK